MASLFRFSDTEAVTSLITRVGKKKKNNNNNKSDFFQINLFLFFFFSAVREISLKTPNHVRNKLVDTTVEMLTAYRKYCATSSSAGQLILPESLKFLPLSILGLIKHKILRPGLDVSIDERASLINYLYSLPIPFLTPILYPRMYALHSLPRDVKKEKKKNNNTFFDFSFSLLKHNKLLGWNCE